MLENSLMKRGATPSQTTSNFFDVSINHGSDEPYNISMSSDGTRYIFGRRALYSAGIFHITSRINSICLDEKTQANPSASYAGEFGTSVSISGNGALAVSSNPGYTTNRAGAVYVYTRTNTTWGQTQLLTEPVGSAGSNAFGTSVKVSRDGLCMAVGSPGKTSGKGAAYAYRRTTGNFAYKTLLTASDGAAGHRFGERVAISDNGYRIVVASPGNQALYVFTSDGVGWNGGIAKIPNVPITATDSLCISEDGDMIAVGFTGYNNGAGKVILFKYVNYTWVVFAEVTETTPGTNHNFGREVVLRTGISSPKLYVCARAPEVVTAEGNIYVYPIGSQAVEPCSKVLTGNTTTGWGVGLFYTFDVSLDGKTVYAISRPGLWGLRTHFYENV